MSLDVLPSDSQSDSCSAPPCPSPSSSSSLHLESVILNAGSRLAQRQAYVGQASAPWGRRAEKQVTASEPRASGPTRSQPKPFFRTHQERRLGVGLFPPGVLAGLPGPSGHPWADTRAVRSWTSACPMSCAKGCQRTGIEYVPV